MKRTEIYRTMTFDDFFSMKPELEQENYVRVDEALRGKGESNKVKGVLPLKVFLSLKEYPSIESHVSKNQFKSRCQDGREKEGESKNQPSKSDSQSSHSSHFSSPHLLPYSPQ